MISSGCPHARKARLCSKDLDARHMHMKGSWAIEQWRQVIFTDETHFGLYENQASQYLQIFPHEEFHPECLSVTVKFPVVMDGTFVESKIPHLISELGNA